EYGLFPARFQIECKRFRQYSRRMSTAWACRGMCGISRLFRHVSKAAVVACLLAINVRAADDSPQPGREPIVTITNYLSHEGVKPGGQITLAIVMDIRKPYHMIAHNA